MQLTVENGTKKIKASAKEIRFLRNGAAALMNYNACDPARAGVKEAIATIEKLAAELGSPPDGNGSGESGNG